MNIQRVAVIGSGVMGSAIAAQVANAGIQVDLLDLLSEDGSRNAIAEAAIARLLKTEPAPLMLLTYAKMIKPGNLTDDLERLREVDWVIEAVVENLDVKRELYLSLQEYCRPDTVISSNTSTLPLTLLLQDAPSDFRLRFMITHFFNPPRYMRLLELVAPAELDPELLDAVSHFADLKLGKGCILCHDTPGFIANRIGTFWMQTAFLEAVRLNLDIVSCDAAMALFGIPKTGVFGLLDLVGLDLMPKVLASFKKHLPADDALAKIADVPPRLQAMLDQGLTGRKGPGGFYRLQRDQGRKIKQGINLASGEYCTVDRVRLGIGHKPEALREFLSGETELSRFVWRVWSDTLCYAASLLPEIADSVDDIDSAMRLGYNWRYGPLELLDRLGVEWFASRLQGEDRAIPALLNDRQTLYRTEQGVLQCRSPAGNYQAVPRADGILLLGDIKRRAEPISNNASASLWDVGDGVACLEFHSKMNTLDPDSLGLIEQAVGSLQADFKGLVIYNEAEHFSAGANLGLLAPALQTEDWTAVTKIIRLGQGSFSALKYAPFPVVGAPSGLALGGGCEILLHCDALVAHAETYMGLVETGVGLVPGWGGCKELLRRWLSFSKRPGGAMPAIAKVFELIALAKVSGSAAEAKANLFLGKHDRISMNRDRLLADAKSLVLQLADNYQPPEAYEYRLPGGSAAAAVDMQIRNLQLAGKISAYDAEIAGRLARILSGGDVDIQQSLSEQDLLDLELEGFLALVKQAGTQARLQHFLETGKPLRN